MQSGGVELLKADEQRLRGAIAALRSGGHFVVVVAEEGAWDAAKAWIEREMGAGAASFELCSGEDVIRMFQSSVVSVDGLVFLHLGSDAAGAIQALNLNRDKLHLQKCKFVLRLDGTAQQARFMKEAPDCYSVRDAAAFVEGRGSFSPPEAEKGAAREASVLVQQTENDAMGPFLWAFIVEEGYHRGDIRGAREALPPEAMEWWSPTGDRLFVATLDAHVLRREGHWEQAERRLRESLDLAARNGGPGWVAQLSYDIGALLVDRGELDAASSILASSALPEADRLRMAIRWERAEPDAFESLRGPLLDAVPASKEIRAALETADEMAGAILRATDAGLLDPNRYENLVLELEKLAQHVAAADSSVPFSPIRAALLVADALLARNGREAEARSAAERALSLARIGVPNWVPACARRVLVAALRVDDLANVDALLTEALEAAEAHRLPSEAAQLAGLRFWLATRRGQNVEQAERDMEAAIERTGDLLLEASILYQVGRGANRRDLLERSRRIYRGLPWPEREVACLEALGMKPVALARCRTFGLKLTELALERRTEPPPIVA